MFNTLFFYKSLNNFRLLILTSPVFLKTNPFIFSYNPMFFNFLKEGLLIDFMQKKSTDLLIKKLLIITTQTLNFSFLNNALIFFIPNVLFLTINKYFFKSSNYNLSNVIVGLVFLSLWLIEVSILFL